MPTYTFKGNTPQIDPTAYIAPGAQVIGNVNLGPNVSIWFNAVLRGDTNFIRVGAGTNIQDGAVVHVDPGEHWCTVGEKCVIGHRAIVHGARIGNKCLVGMGAIVLNGAELGEGCLVGAGALVPQGKQYPPGSVLLGAPAKVVKTLTPAEVEEMIVRGADHYAANAQAFKAEGI